MFFTAVQFCFNTLVGIVHICGYVYNTYHLRGYVNVCILIYVFVSVMFQFYKTKSKYPKEEISRVFIGGLVGMLTGCPDLHKNTRCKDNTSCI